MYLRENIPLAVGDTIRTTSNVIVGDRRVDNGSFLTVMGLTEKGEIETRGRQVASKTFAPMS